MDAVCRRRYFFLRWIATCLFLLLCSVAFAASQRTQNFIIQAPTPQLAQAVAEAAERYRRDLAMHWLGKTLPAWPQPCPIRVVAGPRLAAQGVTTYNPAPVRDFQMEVIGTPQRILDSVLPHEITHTILATYFGRPLPRWADEGICTTVEHSAERKKHEAKLQEFLRSRRGIAMNQLFLLKEYPNDVLPMYAQGYSVCRFLINQQGPRTFISFLEDYMRHPSWTDNIRRHYGYASLAELQQYWLAWVSEGSGEVTKYAKTQLAVSPEQPNVNLGNVALTGGQQPESANSTASVVQATQNQQPGMNLQSPVVNALALTSPDAATANGITKPVTNLTAIGTMTTGSTRPKPKTLPRTSTPLATVPTTGQLASPNASPDPLTATAAIRGYYQRQQEHAQAQRRYQGETGLSQITVPMVPPSIRLSGRYGVNPATAMATSNPAARIGQIRSANPNGHRNGISAAAQGSTATPHFSPAGHYQTAHPQPEQQLSQGGQVVPTNTVPVNSPARSQQSRLGNSQHF
jgi:hypothetical protein